MPSSHTAHGSPSDNNIRRPNSALSWIVVLSFLAAEAWQWTVVGKSFGRDARTPIVLIQLVAMMGYLLLGRRDAWIRRLQTLVFALIFLSTTIVPAIQLVESTLYVLIPNRFMCPMPGDGRMVRCAMFGGEVLFMPLLCLGLLVWYLARARHLPRERSTVRLALTIGLPGCVLSLLLMLPWHN